MTKSCEKIQQYAQELSSLDKIFVDASETLQSEISMSGNETRDQVVKMTSLQKIASIDLINKYWRENGVHME